MIEIYYTHTLFILMVFLILHTFLLLLNFVIHIDFSYSYNICSNENDITERLKRIVQANASLNQEILDTSHPSKSRV